MRATGTIQIMRPPAAARRFAVEVRRAVLACGFTFGVCVAAVLVANWWQASPSAASRSRPSTESELSTGSLLFVAPYSSLCRQRTIDNSTWQIRDNGWVDCDEALAKSANAGTDPRTQGSRLDLIREGFRGKQ
jgi:hypothetical protein